MQGYPSGLTKIQIGAHQTEINKAFLEGLSDARMGEYDPSKHARYPGGQADQDSYKEGYKVQRLLMSITDLENNF